MRVRLADVAQHAGVSEATVSRVLNRRPGVAEEIRRVVLRSVEMLGYERTSRRTATGTGLVGLIVPELTNPVFPLFAQTVETALARFGYTCVLCTQTLDGMHEPEYVKLLLQRDVAGIVFVSGMHANEEIPIDAYVDLRERGLPVVLVNGYRPGIDAHFVSNDDATATELAVAHLAGLRHRRIGLAVGPERYVPVRRRIVAFRSALRRHVRPDATDDDLEALIARTVFSVDGGAEALEALLDHRVTAVVCASDLMALGVIRRARERGLRVPKDLSVVGSDGIELGEHTWPPLTTVRQPVAEMADAVAQAMVAEMRGQTAPRAEVVFRPELVLRGSTVAPDGAAHRVGSTQ